MKKRGLFLGGAHSQVPILEEAKRRGHYVITCDYLPDNPGHKIADEYHNVSTTDIPGVIALAQRVKPDYIMAYASDVAAMTAAVVSEKLGLKYNSVESVRLLSEKNAFRALQKRLGLNVPSFATLGPKEGAEALQDWGNYPCIVKPTDSAGSKGVVRVDCSKEFDQAISHARSFSRSGNVIVEEFIDNLVADLHGDGFVQDSKLVFLHLGDHVYSTGNNPFNPMGTIWPSRANKEYISEISNLVDTIIRTSGFENGAINVEARVSSKGRAYVMEIGARCGGHFVPQAIYHSCGFNIVSAIMDNVDGMRVTSLAKQSNVSAYYAINSKKSGVLKQIAFDSIIQDMVIEKHEYLTSCDRVNSFDNGSAALGIVILKNDSFKRIDDFYQNADKYIKVLVS